MSIVWHVLVDVLGVLVMAGPAQFVCGHHRQH
jgi:hypothetical protein